MLYLYMSNNICDHCNIGEINNKDLDLQNLIIILSLKDYEAIPYCTKKDMQEAYIIALQNVGIYSNKIIKDLILQFFKNISLCYSDIFSKKILIRNILLC